MAVGIIIHLGRHSLRMWVNRPIGQIHTKCNSHIMSPLLMLSARCQRSIATVGTCLPDQLMVLTGKQKGNHASMVIHFFALRSRMSHVLISFMALRSQKRNFPVYKSFSTSPQRELDDCLPFFSSVSMLWEGSCSSCVCECPNKANGINHTTLWIHFLGWCTEWESRQ